MKKYFLLLAILTFIITGCAGTQYFSKAQIQLHALNEQFNGAIAYAKECEAAYAKNPDVVLSYEQVTLNGLNPSNRSELLASNKKLNAKQKKAYQLFLKLESDCFVGAMAKLKGSPYASLFESTDALIAINDANLLTEKVTIGEASSRKLEILSKFHSDLSTLQHQVSTQYMQAHNAEVTELAGKRVESAIAWQGVINNMNTATLIRQNQMNQQLLQQNQYKIPPSCLGFNCR